MDRETVANSDYDVNHGRYNVGAVTKICTAHPQTNAAVDSQRFTIDNLERLTRA